MTDLTALKTCELHVHTGGCLYAEDLLDLGREIYDRIDWRLYIDTYEKAFGIRPDPVALFADALGGNPDGLERFRRHYVVGEQDAGDFGRFQAKFNLIICLYRYWHMILGREEEIDRRMFERHRAEGLRYIEYRTMAPYDAEDPGNFIAFHLQIASAIRAACTADFQARYIISLPRWNPLPTYHLVQALLDQHPELISTIIGLDFCFFEEGYPPKSTRPFFDSLQRDNEQHPERALEVVYHVGETYFDKSLESAIRWCHEAAELGARRLGHATALGLDPDIAIARRPDAHVSEPVHERLDQIAYDLRHREELESYGVEVPDAALARERGELEQQPSATIIDRPYTPNRLEQIRRRQTFTLDRLAERGTSIETCPTSNLRIGGVPAPEHHPIHRFLASPIDLAIGADDPGIFDSPLAAEIDWVMEHAGLSAEDLVRRLGDPYRFRLAPARA
jgi:hypothetical protein